MALKLSESDLENPEVLGEKLMVLTEIVISRHFYASGYLFEDLCSIGVVKALSMIRDGHFDRSKGNFVSFLYTGIRNEVHNFLYHENKKDTDPIDNVLNQGKDDDYFSDGGKVYISYSLVHLVCMSFTKTFGENIENLVISQLEEMGYYIKGRKLDNFTAFTYVYNLIEEEYGKEAEDEVVSRIIGIILWKRKEHALQ